MKMSVNKNLELWNKVCKTDPTFTKEFKGKGGFKGTAICAQWQRFKATELWGPYGERWGVKEEAFDIFQDGQDSHNDLILYRAIFYYPSISGPPAQFPIASDLSLWNYSTTYKSWARNNDVSKKVSTDALTKGLSMLGFSADVFMGKFDDNRYVQEVRKEFNEPVKAKPKPKPATKTTNFEFLKKMGEQKERLGKDVYYDTLLTRGFSHANEIVDREDQQDVGKALRDTKVADREPGEEG
jgi:hypothetical protein